MSLRSPLGQVLGSGSARDGTEHWWAQRVSALALVFLGSWFLLSIVRLDSFAHAAVVVWAGSPINSVLLLLLAVTLAWHSALGVQVVIEDYVHGPFLKVVSLVASRFAHVFLAVAAVVAILTLVFGAST